MPKIKARNIRNITGNADISRDKITKMCMLHEMTAFSFIAPAPRNVREYQLYL